ncbi:DMT family transporter [Oceanobacter mangrovi]|uniref:DMT family transporter n=1 Tax=Oceanobacter mangrovi TaxID=2862510 RepID=UPI001C8DBD30|nr:DMT family transporter [Oceanobacter mangrovi]
MNPAVVLFFASILWGSAWIPLNAIQELGLSHSRLLLVAYSVGALLTWLLVWQRRALLVQAVAGYRRELLGILLFGGVANVSFSIALMEGDVVRVMVLFYLLPVWSTLLGRWWLGEQINFLKTLMIAMALLGVALVAGLKPDNLTSFTSAPWGLADTLGLLAGFTYAANNVLFRRAEAADLPTRVGVMLLGSALSLLLVEIVGVTAADAHGLVAQVPLSAWLFAALYGVSWLMLMSFGSQWGVSKLPASRSALIIIMELVTAVLSAELLGASALDLAGWLGCGLILAASVLDGRTDSGHSQAAVS